MLEKILKFIFLWGCVSVGLVFTLGFVIIALINLAAWFIIVPKWAAVLLLIIASFCLLTYKATKWLIKHFSK
tara:strand:- start:652 stop:867 length:216 start_codon:yes stop_codon:yes gene_type:complete